MRPGRGLAIAGGTALALVALASLRIALGKSLGDWVAAEERARFEREIGSLDPARLEGPVVADADNAVPALVAATTAIGLTAPERALLRDGTRTPVPVGAPDEALDALLDARRAELATLAAAARRSASSFGPRAELFHGAHLDLAAWLTAARLAAVDGERALVAGDALRAGAALDSLLGMTVVLRREPIAYFASVGAAVEWLYLDLVRAHLDGAADATALARLTRDLARLRDLPDAVAVLHGEAVLGHAMLLRTPTVRRPRAGARERLEALLWPWSEGHVVAGYLAGWRELAQTARAPQSRWTPEPERAARRHGAVRRWIDPTVPYETVRALLMPDLLAIARRLQLVAAAEQLTRLAASVALRHAESGALPASIAGWPDAALPDAASGSLPRYELHADGTATLELPAARELVERERPRAGARRLAVERRLRLLRWRIAPDRTSLGGGVSPPLRQEVSP